MTPEPTIECASCWREIEPGEPYEVEMVCTLDGFDHVAVCPECVAAFDAERQDGAA